MMATKTDIALYTASTPNGIKVSILLAELGLDYKLHKISLSEQQQKEPWFLDINPNGRIPAMTDKLADGRSLRVFESGAMMQYLVERYDTEHKVSYPHDSPEHWETTSWLMWQMGGLGPMQGQANFFQNAASQKIEFAINRYVTETRRLFQTMETHLAKSKSGFLVGDRLTIADIACWGWVAAHSKINIPIADYPHLDKWLMKLLQRPGFEKGRHVPDRHTALDKPGGDKAKA